MFACLVIKFETPLVLKVETRATLEQKMMPIKTEQLRTIEKKKTLPEIVSKITRSKGIPHKFSGT